MIWRVVKLDAPEQFGCALYSQDIFKGLVKLGVETPGRVSFGATDPLTLARKFHGHQHKYYPSE